MTRQLPVARVVVAGLGVFALLAATASSTPAKANAVCAKPHFLRSLVLVSTRTGQVDMSFPDTTNPGNNPNAQPLSIVGDGHRGWFIAGQFGCVGKVHVPGIAHLRPDGRLLTSWHGQIPRAGFIPGSQGGVGPLVRWGDTLFALGGASANEWVVALDARTGARLWLVSHLNTAGALAVDRSSVFVGSYGGFRSKGLHRALVALNRRTGAVLPWRAAPPQQFARKLVTVGPLAVAGQRLFVHALTRNGTTAVFALDARTGHLTSWRAPQIKYPGRMLVTHGLVFAAGLHSSNVASARTGSPVTAFGQPGFFNFTAFGHMLYGALGCNVGPSQIQGQTRDLAAVDLRTLRVTPWAPVIKSPICLQALAANQSQVLLSGPFPGLAK